MNHLAIEECFYILGQKISNFLEQYQLPQDDIWIDFKANIKRQHSINAWHTEENIKKSLEILCQTLTRQPLEKYKSVLPVNNGKSNIIFLRSIDQWPLSQCQYLISILLSGNKIIFNEEQCTDKPFVALCKILFLINRSFSEYIVFGNSRELKYDALVIEKNDIDIASTDSYLSKRNAFIAYKNTSVAILDGTETQENLKDLSEQIFRFFGMSPHNIKKIFVPEHYELTKFLDACESQYNIINHNKYANNYQYHQSVYLMNRIEHLDNGFLLLTQNKQTIAPTGVVYFEYYQDYNNTIEIQSKNKQLTDIYTVFDNSNKTCNIKSFNEKLFFPQTTFIDFLNSLQNGK